MELRPSLAEVGTRGTIVSIEDCDRAHQLWFFRNECLVNLKMPWLSLDPSSSLLGLAKYSGTECHKI